MSSDLDPDRWFQDYVTPDLIQLHSIRQVVYSGQTSFQTVEIIDTGSLGRCLVLDSRIQSSQEDEFIYHEALVHPPMLTHPQPEVIFIAGGGEGATLREALAHKSVKRVVMVDLDREVVDICRKFLPSFHQGSFEDPRLELHHVDARKYLAECRHEFDVIIIDLSEPLDGSPAYLLYTQEFYQLVKERLAEGGIISLQAGFAAWNNLDLFASVVNTLRTLFPVVCPYQVHIPSFSGPWGFATASGNLNPLHLPPTEVDQRISTRLTTSLRFYDGLTHQNIFSLPKHLRQSLHNKERLITDQAPLFSL